VNEGANRQQAMDDNDFHREIWRAIVIVLRAFIRRYGFKPPTFD